MLKLSDFFYLPQLATAVAQLTSDGPGLIVVAGLDPRPNVANALKSRFLPSGRTTIFRTLMSEILAAAPETHAIIITEDSSFTRFTPAQRRRVTVWPHKAQATIAARITEAAKQQPGLLVIDRLTAASAQAAVAAAASGIKVLTQLDSVLYRDAITRHLADLGVPPEQLNCLTWTVFVQRMPTMCPSCRQEAVLSPAQQLQLFQNQQADSNPAFFQAQGCQVCGGTGRQGDVALFDIFRFPEDRSTARSYPSLLALEQYARELALAGYLAVDDLLVLDADQLWRTYHLLTASEQALAGSNATLERRLAQLHAANAVLEQRTTALLSLQDVGQALISTTDLNDLVARVCRHTRELCGAERVVLYLFQPDHTAEILAVNGWSPLLLHRRIDMSLIAIDQNEHQPVPFNDWPPGIPQRHPDVDGGALRAGLRVPLVAEHQQLGVMIVHSTRKKRFAPGEVALLQTLANQAALSIQRATLISQLREKINQLEAAQAALVERERLEREMELARQVQQSVLPRIFPSLPGYRFAARNEPARQVGGDFYDVFTLDDGHIGVVIGDVSGKGMPAALYMALTRSLLLAEARRERSPQLVLLNVNRLLRELGDPHMFVTVFYGVIAVREQRLTFARAGHDYPLLFRNGSVISLGGLGTVLGCFDLPELQLSEETIDLVPEDRLVLYTDGLTDIQNPKRQRFELERLTNVFRSHAALPPDALCDATFADLAAFQENAAQYDDMTMLVVSVRAA